MKQHHTEIWITLGLGSGWHNSLIFFNLNFKKIFSCKTLTNVIFDKILLVIRQFIGKMSQFCTVNLLLKLLSS